MKLARFAPLALLLALGGVSLAGAARAENVQIDPKYNTVTVKPAATTPLGYQQITALSASTALSPPAGSTVAYVTVETQAVRWRDDGTAPTAGIGNPVPVGAQLVYSGSLSAVRFIQQAASATIDVVYY